MSLQQLPSKALPAFIGRLARPALQPAQELPEWLQRSPPPAKPCNTRQPLQNAEAAASTTAASSTPAVQGVHYEVYIGARLRLYSNKKQEEHLRSMHDSNHRELPIARLAARVADFLWPNCQEMIDEAVAKSKRVTRNKQADEEEFVPPEVPHFLPFTNWIRNSEVVRESFICDKTTRYKPRMSWYNPNDGMFPSGWWSEGLMADLAYYRPLMGTRQPHQKW